MPLRLSHFYFCKAQPTLKAPHAKTGSQIEKMTQRSYRDVPVDHNPYLAQLPDQYTEIILKIADFTLACNITSRPESQTGLKNWHSIQSMAIYPYTNFHQNWKKYEWADVQTDVKLDRFY